MNVEKSVLLLPLLNLKAIILQEAFPILDDELIEYFENDIRNEISHVLPLNKSFADSFKDGINYSFFIISTAKERLELVLNNRVVVNPSYSDIIEEYFKITDSNFEMVLKKLLEVCKLILESEFGLKTDKVTYKKLSEFNNLVDYIQSLGDPSAGGSTDPGQRTVTQLGGPSLKNIWDLGKGSLFLETLVHETIHRVTDFANVRKAFDVYTDDKEKFRKLKIDEQLKNPDSYTHCFLALGLLE